MKKPNNRMEKRLSESRRARFTERLMRMLAS
jgi:hypothetical protein